MIGNIKMKFSSGWYQTGLLGTWKSLDLMKNSTLSWDKTLWLRNNVACVTRSFLTSVFSFLHSFPIYCSDCTLLDVKLDSRERSDEVSSKI